MRNHIYRPTIQYGNIVSIGGYEKLGRKVLESLTRTDWTSSSNQSWTTGTSSGISMSRKQWGSGSSTAIATIAFSRRAHRGKEGRFFIRRFTSPSAWAPEDTRMKTEYRLISSISPRWNLRCPRWGSLRNATRWQRMDGHYANPTSLTNATSCWYSRETKHVNKSP